jgi:methylated-DNA-[protein]-cysteine S-methyltransferase
MSKQQWTMKSPLGPLHLVATATGLSGLFLRERDADADAETLEQLDPKTPPGKHLFKAARELEEYFAGRRRDFTVTLDPQGTPFQRKVWQQLRRIPYGQTCSYGEVARALGNEKASRAVGTANGRNPISIIVPCHRVIAADGTLGGYSGGLDKKRQLLSLEA